jgi:hypothetical protein
MNIVTVRCDHHLDGRQATVNGCVFIIKQIESSYEECDYAAVVEEKYVMICPSIITQDVKHVLKTDNWMAEVVKTLCYMKYKDMVYYNEHVASAVFDSIQAKL